MSLRSILAIAISLAVAGLLILDPGTSEASSFGLRTARDFDGSFFRHSSDDLDLPMGGTRQNRAAWLREAFLPRGNTDRSWLGGLREHLEKVFEDKDGWELRPRNGDEGMRDGDAYRRRIAFGHHEIDLRWLRHGGRHHHHRGCGHDDPLPTIPEPSTAILLGLGLAGLGYAGRIRRNG